MSRDIFHLSSFSWAYDQSPEGSDVVNSPWLGECPTDAHFLLGGTSMRECNVNFFFFNRTAACCSHPSGLRQATPAPGGWRRQRPGPGSSPLPPSGAWAGARLLPPRWGAGSQGSRLLRESSGALTLPRCPGRALRGRCSSRGADTFCGVSWVATPAVLNDQRYNGRHQAKRKFKVQRSVLCHWRGRALGP